MAARPRIYARHAPKSCWTAAADSGAPSAISATALHVRIIRPTATFRHHPIDILRRILDVAGLAMDAVLRVDLQTRVTFFGSDDFVNPGRAISLLRSVIEREIDLDGHGCVLQGQELGRASCRERGSE